MVSAHNSGLPDPEHFDASQDPGSAKSGFGPGQNRKVKNIILHCCKKINFDISSFEKYYD